MVNSIAILGVCHCPSNNSVPSNYMGTFFTAINPKRAGEKAKGTPSKLDTVYRGRHPMSSARCISELHSVCRCHPPHPGGLVLVLACRLWIVFIATDV